MTMGHLNLVFHRHRITNIKINLKNIPTFQTHQSA